MAVKGQKAKNTKAKGTKGNPTRTKVKTPNISPQQVSRYKNDANKATSKAILQVQKVTGTGPNSTIGKIGITVDRGHLGGKYGGPAFKVDVTKGTKRRSTLRVVRKVVKNKNV